MMLVGYGPSLVDFAPADGQAKVEALLFPAGSGFFATHRRYDKSDILTGSDSHFNNVEGDGIA